MRTVKHLIAAIIVLMLVNDILQIYLEYKARKKGWRRKRSIDSDRKGRTDRARDALPIILH